MTLTAANMIGTIEQFWTAVHMKDMEKAASFLSDKFEADYLTKEKPQVNYDSTRHYTRAEFIEYLKECFKKIEYLSFVEGVNIVDRQFEEHTRNGLMKGTASLIRHYKLANQMGTLYWNGSHDWTFNGTHLVGLKVMMIENVYS